MSGAATLLAAGGAPGWVILPAAAVLGYAYLVLSSGETEGGPAAVAWHLVWSVLGLAAFGAVVWWVPTVA